MRNAVFSLFEMTKKWKFILITFFILGFGQIFSAHVFAQAATKEYKRFRKIDNRAKKAPENVTTSVQMLTDYLTMPAKNERQKVRAIYIWIANNIHYDDTAFFHGTEVYKKINWVHYQKQKAENVLKNRVAVCEGYANLFKKMCEQANITAECITGSCKDMYGNLADMKHAWCVVKVGNEWFMTDPTWGAGAMDTKNQKYIRRYNDAYFLPDKNVFLKDHFPDDPLWQFSEKLMSEADFAVEWKDRKPNASPFFAYKDTLSLWEKQDSSTRKLQELYRILRYYPQNEHGIVGISNYYMGKAQLLFAEVDSSMKVFKQNKDFPINPENLYEKLTIAEKYVETAQNYFARIPTEETKRKDWQDYKENFPLIRASICMSRWGIDLYRISLDYQKTEEEDRYEDIPVLLASLTKSENQLSLTKSFLLQVKKRDSSVQRLNFLIQGSYGFAALLRAALFSEWVHQGRQQNQNNFVKMQARLDTAEYFLLRADSIQNQIDRMVNNSENPHTLTQEEADDLVNMNALKNKLRNNMQLQKMGMAGMFIQLALQEFEEEDANIPQEKAKSIENLFEKAEKVANEIKEDWQKVPNDSSRMRAYTKMEMGKTFYNKGYFYLRMAHQEKENANTHFATAETALIISQNIISQLSSSDQQRMLEVVDLRDIQVLLGGIYYEKARAELDKMEAWVEKLETENVAPEKSDAEYALQLCKNAESLHEKAMIYFEKTKYYEKGKEGVNYFLLLIANMYEQVSHIYKLMIKGGTSKRPSANEMTANLRIALSYLDKAESYLYKIPQDSKLYDSVKEYLNYLAKNKKNTEETIRVLEK